MGDQIIVGVIIGVILLVIGKILGWWGKLISKLWNFVTRYRLRIPGETVKIVPQKGGTWWGNGSVKGKPAMQISGSWYVTNIINHPVLLLHAYIENPHVEGFILTRHPEQNIYGSTYPILPKRTTEISTSFWIEPPICKDGDDLKASVILIDQFSNKHKLKNVIFKGRIQKESERKGERENNQKPKEKWYRKWWMGLVAPAFSGFIFVLIQLLLPQLLLSTPKLEFLLREDGQNIVIGIKNIGEVGIKNLTITKLSETYLDIPGEYDGFAGTGYAQTSEFNNPGENWLTSEYLSPGGLPIEKETHWPVNGDQYTSVEVFNAYYQRESDLKQFSDQFIFITRNQKAYTIDEARNDSYLVKVVERIPEIINKPLSPSRYYQGVKKIK